MFSGIVEETGIVRKIDCRENLLRLTVTAKKTFDRLEVSHSIAINGTCLTVVEKSENAFTVELVAETQQRTNLGQLKQGSAVNLENSLGAGADIGGHFVQGHVDGVGMVRSLDQDGQSLITSFSASPEIMKYIVPKGFIAIDGISLTVVGRWADGFSIAFIPYTLEHTIAGSYEPGVVVNIEVDILGKYVERFINNLRNQGSVDISPY